MRDGLLHFSYSCLMSAVAAAELIDLGAKYLFLLPSFSSTLDRNSANMGLHKVNACCYDEIYNKRAL